MTTLPQGTLAAPRAPSSLPRYLGRNGRQIDLQGQSVAQYVASYVSAARVGNIDAAYAVYQALSICANLDQPLAEYADQNERLHDMRAREEVKTVCATISPAQIQERLRFLSLAANAGKPNAAIDFYMDGPGQRRGHEVTLEDGAQTQWRTDALAHLLRAAQQCDQFVLSLLSTAYENGQLGERNLTLAVAYSAANGYAGKHPRSTQQLQAQFEGQPSAAELADGMQLGSRLAQQACHD